jgi:hypothetical protein
MSVGQEAFRAARRRLRATLLALNSKRAYLAETKNATRKKYGLHSGRAEAHGSGQEALDGELTALQDISRVVREPGFTNQARAKSQGP